MSRNLVEETPYNEEWWQPELNCLKCGCTFMYSSYPNFPKYPTYCPNCGTKFSGLKSNQYEIYPFE